MAQILQGGVVDTQTLQDLFVQSIVANDMDSARILAEVIKSQKEPRGGVRLVQTTDEEDRPITALVDNEGTTIREYPRSVRRRERDMGATIEIWNEDTGEIIEVKHKTASPSTELRENQLAFANTRALVQDFQLSIKPYRRFADSFARVKAAVANPSGPNDLTLLTSFMKMIDEGSVVRQSEFDLAASVAVWFDRAKVALGRAAGRSQFLTDETRAEFLAASQNFADIAARGSAALTSGYGELFTSFNLSVPSLIFDPFVRQGIVEASGGIDYSVFDDDN